MPIQPNHFCENSNSTQPLMYTSAHTPHTSGGMPPSQNTMVGTGDTFFTIEALHDALTIQAAEQQRTLKRTRCESTRTTHICGSDDSDESCPYRVTASLQEGEVVVHLHAEHTCTAAHHKRKTYGETTTLRKEFAGVRENPRMTPSHMRALLTDRGDTTDSKKAMRVLAAVKTHIWGPEEEAFGRLRPMLQGRVDDVSGKGESCPFPWRGGGHNVCPGPGQGPPRGPSGSAAPPCLNGVRQACCQQHPGAQGFQQEPC